MLEWATAQGVVGEGRSASDKVLQVLPILLLLAIIYILLTTATPTAQPSTAAMAGEELERTDPAGADPTLPAAMLRRHALRPFPPSCLLSLLPPA